MLCIWNFVILFCIKDLFKINVIIIILSRMYWDDYGYLGNGNKINSKISIYWD